MPSTKTVFVCQTCGSKGPRWQGKCPNCESWNSIVEEVETETRYSPARKISPQRDATGTPYGIRAQPLRLAELQIQPQPYPTLPEVDRVLGGGLIPGSLLLVGGAPGVGKSTLLLQVASQVSQSKPVLYVSGEESENQTKLRAERLSLHSESLHILHEISLDSILRHIEALNPSLAIIDSIQTVYKEEIGSAPGSVAQVRECAGELLRFSKNRGIAIILVGHITKDGSIAGPRVLEHIVDSVLYLEGESHQAYRMLRAFKNRFGSTKDVGIFEMTGTGLREVKNPSGLFLESRANSPGCVVVPVLEGQRPLLIELQALVCRTWAGFPKRTATGIDANRMAILLAVLEKRCHLPFGQSDVYVNVTGALKIKEPAADLAMALAIVSSAKEQLVPMDWVIFGEVGLGGEVRPVSFCEERLREAAQVGFRKAIVPKANLSAFSPEGLLPHGVGTLQEAMEFLCNS